LEAFFFRLRSSPRSMITSIAMLQNYLTFQLNADYEIVGTGEAYFCDTNGENCAKVESLTFTGKRMNAQHS